MTKLAGELVGARERIFISRANEFSRYRVKGGLLESLARFIGSGTLLLTGALAAVGWRRVHMKMDTQRETAVSWVMAWGECQRITSHECIAQLQRHARCRRESCQHTSPALAARRVPCSPARLLAKRPAWPLRKLRFDDSCD